MKTRFLLLPSQTTFSITTNSDSLIHLLYLKYGNYLSNHFHIADLDISVIEKKQSFTISTKYYSCDTLQPLNEIDRYIFDHTTYDSSFLALHGAAVEYEGVAYLFLAPTTSGKTTLTSYLTNLGFGYLTDDCILLNKQSFHIHPFTTPIHLRKGGLTVLNRLGIELKEVQHLKEHENTERFVYSPKKCITTPIPLKTIFFIKRTENENCLKEINTIERITSLLKAPITNYELTSDYLRFLSKLSKEECYQLLYCDMNYVKELIEHG